MSCKNYIHVETELIWSLQRADFTNDARIAIYDDKSYELLTMSQYRMWSIRRLQ